MRRIRTKIMNLYAKKIIIFGLQNELHKQDRQIKKLLTMIQRVVMQEITQY